MPPSRERKCPSTYNPLLRKNEQIPPNRNNTTLKLQNRRTPMTKPNFSYKFNLHLNVKHSGQGTIFFIKWAHASYFQMSLFELYNAKFERVNGLESYN